MTVTISFLFEYSWYQAKRIKFNLSHESLLLVFLLLLISFLHTCENFTESVDVGVGVDDGVLLMVVLMMLMLVLMMLMLMLMSMMLMMLVLVLMMLMMLVLG